MSLAAVVLAGCSKPEIDAPVAEEITYNTVLTAEIPQTKVAIDAEYTKLTWNNGDRISVLTSAGTYKEFVYTGEDGATSAEFKGTLGNGETVAGYAIYPAHAQHAVVEGCPSVYLPAEHAWKAAEVKGPMVAAITEGTASFSHAGGLFAFDVTGMPAGAKGFRFETNGVNISGSFAYGEDKILKAAEGQNTVVTMTFDALEEAAAMRFHVPVPTGSYEGFTISYINAEGMAVEIRSATATNVIEAATVKYFTVEVADGGAWYVKADGSATASGLSWANATTLTNALAKAEDGDVIFVGAGTYIPETFISGKVVDADDVVASEVTTATDPAHKAFIVDKNVTILGGYPAAGGATCDPTTNETILSGNDVCNHVVLVSAPKVAGKSVKMSGFTVTEAASTNVKGGWQINETNLENYTGAMAAVGTELSLSDMTFTGNKTVNATGIYGANSKVDIKDCTFTENTASANGTVWFTDGSELTFSNSEISNNTANNAAGLYLYLSEGAQMTANVSNVTISENTSTDRGALYLRTATVGQNLNLVIEDCLITKNNAERGAGVFLLNASGITINETKIAENVASGNGGALFFEAGSSNQVGNCMITGNEAVMGASGVITNGDCEFKGCLVSSNASTGNGNFYVNTTGEASADLLFDGCEFCDNYSKGMAGGIYAYNNGGGLNVDIVNSVFAENVTGGRGGALYIRNNTTADLTLHCANTTFALNTSGSWGSAINLYGAATKTDIVSCTVTGNDGTNANYAGAVTCETAGTTFNIYNSIISGNTNNGNSAEVAIKSGVNATINHKYNFVGAEYYGADGAVAEVTPAFDFATMLGALNDDGVCPLLLPESNPAVTGGMSPAELSALASTNVPASVLTVDQLGNARTGNAIGAYVGGLPQSQASL